jgi:hypothetical protein
MMLVKYVPNRVKDGSGELIVMAYDPGRFITSHEVSLVENTKNQYYTLYQEIVDKTGMKV